MSEDPVMRMGSAIANTLYQELQKRALLQRVDLTAIEEMTASVMNALTPGILQAVVRSMEDNKK